MVAVLLTVVVYNARDEKKRITEKLNQTKKVNYNGKVYRTKNSNRPPLW